MRDTTFGISLVLYTNSQYTMNYMLNCTLPRTRFIMNSYKRIKYDDDKAKYLDHHQ